MNRAPVARKTMTNAEIENIINQATDRSARKVFAILGVDIDKPSEVENFRKDLRFSQTLRNLGDKGLVGITLGIAGLIVAAILAGLKVKLGT